MSSWHSSQIVPWSYGLPQFHTSIVPSHSLFAPSSLLQISQVNFFRDCEIFLICLIAVFSSISIFISLITSKLLLISGFKSTTFFQKSSINLSILSRSTSALSLASANALVKNVFPFSAFIQSLDTLQIDWISISSLLICAFSLLISLTCSNVISFTLTLITGFIVSKN